MLCWSWIVRCVAMLTPTQYYITYYLANIIIFTYAISLINLRGIYFCSLVENLITFFVIHFSDILNIFLVNSWNFQKKYFDFFSFLSQNGISITMKGFCYSSKLGLIIYESSKSFVDLMKSVTILLQKCNGFQLYEIFYEITDFCIKICRHSFCSVKITKYCISFVTFWYFWRTMNWQFCCYPMYHCLVNTVNTI